MNKHIPRWYIMVLVLILSLVVGACTPAATETSVQPTEPQVEDPTGAPPAEEPTEEPAAERPPVTIRLRDMDMQQLDPAFLGRSGDAWIAFNIYNRLVRWKVGSIRMEIEPDLATSWEFSDDGTELTFHLREGVMWHRGYGEVTAEDVKFSFDRIIDPETGSAFNTMFSIIDNVEVVDKYTVKLNLTDSTATLITSNLPWYPGFIISKKAFEELGQEEYALNPIGSGPFVFESWTPGTEVVLSANDEYYEGAPQIAELRMLPIVDETAGVIALQAGDVSLAWLNMAESLQVLAEDPSIVLQPSPSFAGRYLWLDTTEPPLDNVLVRQALYHATDQDTISEFGFDGIHKPLHTIFMPNFLCYKSDVPTYDYDLEKAKKLLEDAGFPDGFKLTLLYSQRQVSLTIAEMVQDMWKDIGVELEITGLEHGTYTSIRKSPEERKDYDIIQTHFGRTGDPDSFVIETLHSGAFPPGSNASYYDKIDDLIEAGRTELDTDKRCEIYTQMQDLLQNDVPAIPIVHTTFWFATHESLQGFVPSIEFYAFPMFVEE